MLSVITCSLALERSAEKKEFVVNANTAAGEARESYLARSAWNIGWACTAARERRMLDGLAQR